MYKNNGFTLLELIISLAMIALLAVLGVSEYQQTIRKSRRVDAQTTLLDYHARLQRCFLDHYDYIPCAEQLKLTTPQHSFNAFYLISTLEITKKNYTLQAFAIGTQEKDDICYQFTLDTQQQKRAYTKTNEESPYCW